MSYAAIVCSLIVREHPNADNLQLADAAGIQVVVGLDQVTGIIGVLFPGDGQLSQEYCDANDLIGYKDPETGERKGGYFDHRRKVRVQRFRGERSEGFWMPLDSLKWTGYDISKLKEGDQFTELNGHEICRKYYTPATLKAMRNAAKNVSRKNEWFPQHVDTDNIKHHLNDIKPGSLVTITTKLHGTSGRIAHVLDETEVPLKWWEKILKRTPKMITEWKYLIGTRRVILRDRENLTTSFYDDESFRWSVVDNLVGHLRMGEIIYGEIVGYQPDGRPLMGTQKTDVLKEIRKKYGPEMIYHYGLPQGQSEFYVYRICVITEDKHVMEYSWPQVKARCEQLGLKYVPEEENSFLLNKFELDPRDWENVDNGTIPLKETLQQYILDITNELATGPDPIGKTHIKEGVVVRLDRPDGSVVWLKNKSFEFGVLEGYIKQNEDYVDLEEIS